MKEYSILYVHVPHFIHIPVGRPVFCFWLFVITDSAADTYIYVSMYVCILYMYIYICVYMYTLYIQTYVVALKTSTEEFNRVQKQRTLGLQ